MTESPTEKRARKPRAATAAPTKDPKTRLWGFRCDIPADEDGNRRQTTRRRGFRTKREADTALDELRHSLTKSTYVAPKRQTLGKYLTDDWLPAVRRELAASTWESYNRNIRLHVKPRIGHVQLQLVDGPLLDRFYSDLLASGRKLGAQSPGLSNRTVRYISTILSGALAYAVKQNRLVVNPATRAKPPSAGVSKSPEMSTWTAVQVREFLALCEGDRYHFPFAFLALTGARRGEVLGLRWSDLSDGDGHALRWTNVPLDRATASIVQSVIPLTKASGKGREGRILPRTKTDGPRVIELDKPTVAMLLTWRARQAEERLKMGPGYTDHDLIFCRPDGLPYHPESFSKTFERRLGQPKYACLPRIRLHDLRHTWATLALAAGIDVAIVARRLGHSSTSTTWTTYQHVVPGMQTDAADKVADLIFGT